MKRLLPLVTLVVSATLPCASLAAQQRIVPFLGGGLASGMGDLSSDTDNGWLVFAGADVPLSFTPGLSFGVVGSYAHIPYQGAFGEATNVGGIFGELGYVIAAASPGMFKPYLRGGVGLLVQQYDPGSITTASSTESRVGVSAGAGLNVLLRATTLFAGVHAVTDGDAGLIAFHGGVALRGAPSASLK